LNIAGWIERSRADGYPVRSWSVAGAARAALIAGTVLLATQWTGTATARVDQASAVKPTQELVTLLSSHDALRKPFAGSASVGRVQERRPITEARTMLPVLAHKTSSDGRRWLEVGIPGRPNGRTGWISRRSTALSVTYWHVLVSTSSRRVSVFRRGRRIRVFSAIVGKPSTPTPLGSFFVEESIKLSSGAVGAPFALALSARSNVLQEFDGGPGQIALHGLMNVGGSLGTAASHGCVRLDNGAMSWLAHHVGPGAPVTITG
jgi:lipoprotein-anchoring transpeptidase ErfK/SrfK